MGASSRVSSTWPDGMTYEGQWTEGVSDRLPRAIETLQKLKSFTTLDEQQQTRLNELITIRGMRGLKSLRDIDSHQEGLLAELEEKHRV